MTVSPKRKAEMEAIQYVLSKRKPRTKKEKRDFQELRDCLVWDKRKHVLPCGAEKSEKIYTAYGLNCSQEETAAFAEIPVETLKDYLEWFPAFAEYVKQMRIKASAIPKMNVYRAVIKESITGEDPKNSRWMIEKNIAMLGLVFKNEPHRMADMLMKFEPDGAMPGDMMMTGDERLALPADSDFNQSMRAIERLLNPKQS